MADVAALQKQFAANQEELERSQRVQNQLQTILEQLEQKANELSEANAQLRKRAEAEARKDARCTELESEMAEQQAICKEKESEHQRYLDEVHKEREGIASMEAKQEDCLAQAREESARAEALEAERQRLDLQTEELTARLRNMVARDTLTRTENDEKALETRLKELRDEGEELRTALMDSWAARADVQTANPTSYLEDLNNFEEELAWLKRAQLESNNEQHRGKQLERQEAQLQRQIRELSEEKAALQSDRLDLGSVGESLREAMASQSEGWVRRVNELEQHRKTMDEERMKLITQIADLQARVKEIGPELESIKDLEERHKELEDGHRRLLDESRRLREVNGALGVLLLGDEGPSLGEGDESSALAKALSRTVELSKRLRERHEAQGEEKEQLQDRIREMERLATQPPTREEVFAPDPRGAAAKAQNKKTSSSSSSSSKPSSAGLGSALRGGWGKLRDAAANVVL